MGSVTQTLACALTSIPTRTMYDVDITQVLVSDPERIKSLAQYKNIHRDFIEDKRSAYWTDGPIKVQNDNRLTQNQRNLAKPKLPHIKYKGDRPSPKWKVSKKALNANITERQRALARPKPPHSEWRQDQPVQTQIDKRQLQSLPTEHILRLSMPKQADSRYLKPSISLEELGALKNHTITIEENQPEWVERLSMHKQSPAGYKPDRPVRWIVKLKTRNAEITEHVDKLAKIQRTDKRPGPDPNIVDNPYAVSRAARKTEATPRINELALPLPRKVRNKKVT